MRLRKEAAKGGKERPNYNHWLVHYIKKFDRLVKDFPPGLPFEKRSALIGWKEIGKLFHLSYVTMITRYKRELLSGGFIIPGIVGGHHTFIAFEHDLLNWSREKAKRGEPI